MKNKLKRILIKIIKSHQEDETIARQEYILNILLTTTIFLIFLGTLIVVYRLVFSNLNNYKENSLSLFFILIILLFFISLYFLSRRGQSKISAHIFLATLFTIATYMGYKWGVDLPAEILFYVLVIVISGILLGNKPAFMATAAVSLIFIILGYLQKINVILANRSWINEPWGHSDAVMSSIILFIIAIVSYLFNHELKKSFKKIQESETELKLERDLLEIRVEEKTKELKISQAEEMAQIYRFAEFGRLSSGFFHDLANPLTTVMLNVNKIKIDGKNMADFNLIKSDLEQAAKASEKMKDFIRAVRKQIKFPGKKERFCLNQEIEDAISVLNYKACKSQVYLFFSADEKITTLGDSIKFNQIATNLISNAIDAYDETDYEEKIVQITLNKQANNLIFCVSDSGRGMEDDTLNKIFEPFFTTKTKVDNLGLGLSLIKKIIEEDFLGDIKVNSSINKGTTFFVTLPQS
ncbi:MAG: HAMP domain-containing sensor histidine kinase [Candidatus Falkowbacteria bacterium]